LVDVWDELDEQAEELLVAALGAELARVDGDLVDSIAGREDHAVAIADVAAAGGEAEGAELLAVAALGVGVVLDDGDAVGLDGDEGEAEQEGAHDDGDPPVDGAAVGGHRLREARDAAAVHR
jgi:hypothetical protein